MGPQGDHSTNMGMPRSSLMQSYQDADAMTVFIAQGIALFFTLSELAFTLAFVPAILRVYENQGIELPAVLQFASFLDWWGLSIVVLSLNALIFWLCAWAAQKYWVGIVYVPPVIYLGLSSGLFAASVIPALSVILN